MMGDGLTQRTDVCFPVLAIEVTYLGLVDVEVAEAVGVDAVAIGVGARDIERLYTAGGAEQVFGLASIETVVGECLLAGQQFELISANDQV